MESSGGDTTWSSRTEKASPRVVSKSTMPSRRPSLRTWMRRPSLRTRVCSVALVPEGGASACGIESSGGETTWSSATENRSPFVVSKRTWPSRRASRRTAIRRPSLSTSTSSARTTDANASRSRKAETTRRARAMLELRVPRRLDVRQAHAADHELIAAPLGRGLEAGRARGGDEVVLIDSVAGDPDGAGQPAALVEGNAAGEDGDPVAEPRLAGHAVAREQAALDEIELEPGVEDAPRPDRLREGALARGRDPGREERLGEEPDGAGRVGHAPVQGHAVPQVTAQAQASQHRGRVRAAEEERGAALLHGDVDPEARGIGVLEEAEHVAAQVDHRDRDACGAAQGLANGRARARRLLGGLGQDRVHVACGQGLARARGIARVGLAGDSAPGHVGARRLPA